MSVATKPNPVLAKLQALRQGTAARRPERLANLWRGLANYPPDALAREIAKRLGPGGVGANMRDPAFSPAPAPRGRAPEAARAGRDDAAGQPPELTRVGRPGAGRA
jgi:hypothetical protein